MSIYKIEDFPQDRSEQLIKLLNYTNQSIFLTGKAGTGKTTLLKSLSAIVKKNFLITAPTGIAAINAEGITLHSLFQLPNGVFTPAPTEENDKNIFSIANFVENKRYDRSKRYLLKKLELLIIDEISMVRADLIDLIDQLLKKIRGQYDLPFGGVQLLLIGDLYQLSPVLTNVEEQFYKSFYKTTYFFSAQILADYPIIYLELDKVYRQKSQKFIEFLNNLRIGTTTVKDAKLLDEYKISRYRTASDGATILTSHVAIAEKINEERLRELKGEEFIYHAIITGAFFIEDLPIEKRLRLKIGSRVIFTKNDTHIQKLYYNGKMGVITQLFQDRIFVKCENEPEIEVQRESWTNANYLVTENGLSKQQVGELSQYPIRLAWAITIHKSQGMTLQNAVIDVSQAFTPGQVYVAFSRLKDLTGLFIVKDINLANIKPHPELSNFENKFVRQNIEEKYGLWILEYIFRILQQGLEVSEIQTSFVNHFSLINHWIITKKYAHADMSENWLKSLEDMNSLVNKFNLELEKILRDWKYDVTHLENRVHSATNYLDENFLSHILSELESQIEESIKLKDQKDFINSLQSLKGTITIKQNLFKILSVMVTALNASGSLEVAIDQYRDSHKVSVVEKSIQIGKKGSNQKISKAAELTLKVFQRNIPIEELAQIRKVTTALIERHLVELVETGSIPISEIIDKEIYSRMSYLDPSLRDVSQLRIVTKGEFSFFELRLYLSHLEYWERMGSS